MLSHMCAPSTLQAWAMAWARLGDLDAHLALFGRCAHHARCRMGPCAGAFSINDDKAAESLHLGYKILYSRICGLIGAHATIFDE